MTKLQIGEGIRNLADRLVWSIIVTVSVYQLGGIWAALAAWSFLWFLNAHLSKINEAVSK